MLACLLWPLSQVVRAVTALRRALFRLHLIRSTRLPVPVIVVGNIYVGGTGKTPLTIWLVGALRDAGYRPGVISRGYGAGAGIAQAVTSESVAAQVGDEPLLIAQRVGCPVVIGRKRIDAARLLLEHYPDVNILISDDGLQHYAMQRDLEIMLFDARGLGNGWLLPAGPLREPRSRRRDLTIVNANASTLPRDMPTDAVSMRLQPSRVTALMAPETGLALEELIGTDRKLVAAAGIGNPQRFFAMLRGSGIVFDALPLPDHYDYAVNPFAQVAADIILITEKDAVKCRQNDAMKADSRLWVVPVEAHFDASPAQRILEMLHGPPTA